MAPYIWGTKNNVHLINVAKTAVQLDKACKALEKIVAEGKTVLWIGTKKPAQQTMMNAAQLVGMPYVTHRWIGGTLTNFPQVKKSVTRYLHFKDVVTKADTVHYTKKELNTFQKIVKTWFFSLFLIFVLVGVRLYYRNESLLKLRIASLEILLK
jgi:small subunit ribosomal protein S2